MEDHGTAGDRLAEETTGQRQRRGRRIPRPWLVAGGVLVGLLVLGALRLPALLGQRAEGPGGPTVLERLDDHGAVPPFALTERSGRRVTREDLRGLVWAVNFIYTECTDTCPTQSLQVARLQREFAEASDLRLVSITVDPAHDTPAILREYAARYGAGDRWLFLTGEQRAIHCLARAGFKLGVVDPSMPQPADCGTPHAAGVPSPTLGATASTFDATASIPAFGPSSAWASHGSKGLVMHSPRIVLVDRAGRIRAYHLATDPESMQHLRKNLRRLLAEAAPASGRSGS